MRTTLRGLLCLLLFCSIAFAAVPRQAPPPETAQTDCCAKMKTQSATRECDRHAPKSSQDQDCCALCSIGLALVVTFAAPFVYPPVGDETFTAYISSEHNHSRRPPVPPPRA